MSGDVTPYTNLITSEHASKPNFMAMVAQTMQPGADLLALYQQMSLLYDLDQAVGVQLDVLGEWVGVTRNLTVGVTGVFFSLDIAPGLDEGVIWNPDTTPNQVLTQLPDDHYRLLLQVRILNNQWNGSLSDLYAMLDALFPPVPGNPYVFIQDNCNETMVLGFTLVSPDPLTQALLTQGDLDVKPAGVQISNYAFPSVAGPIFALDIENAYFAGLDVGALAVLV